MTWVPTAIKWYVADLDDWSGRILPQVTGVFWWEPVVRIKRIIDGVWADATEMMFNGYALSGSRRGWQYIEQATGMTLLRTGKRPVELMQMELDRIRADEGIVVNREPDFAEGQAVVVRARARSSFAGLRGRFRKVVWVKGGKMVMVELDLYGERRRVVTVPADYLEAMS